MKELIIKMISNEEKINLIHSLMAASNAFHDKLKECGYYISYGLDGTKTGKIKRVDVPPNENWSLGDLSIIWKIKK